MGGGGRPHTPAASTPGKDPVPTVQEAGWAPGTVWTGGKSRYYTLNHFLPKTRYFLPKPHYFLPKPRYFLLKSRYFVPKPRYFLPKPRYFLPKSRYFVPKPRYFLPKPRYFLPSFSLKLSQNLLRNQTPNSVLQ